MRRGALAAQRPLLDLWGNGVSHVVWRGGHLVDLAGNVWTMNGTVPQVPRSGKTPAGAGPYSDPNYYSLGTGSDVLDFTGDFTACLVVIPATFSTSERMWLSDGAIYTSGWWLESSPVGVAGSCGIGFSASGTVSRVVAPGTPLIAGAVNVICAGRSGASGVISANGGTYTSAAAGTITPGTTYTANLGRYSSAGLATQDVVLELLISTTTPSAPLFTAMAQRVHSKLGITAW